MPRTDPVDVHRYVGAVGCDTVEYKAAPAGHGQPRYRAAVKGDADAATAVDEQLVGLHKDLFIESNPIPVKWAVYKLGLIQAGIRLPLTWLSESAEPQVLKAMQQAGVI